MRVECPYCSATVDVTGLDHHVRVQDGDDHGPHGTVPVEGFDNPWNVRLDFSAAPNHDEDSSAHADDASSHDETAAGDVPTVEHVIDDTRRGRCPACERGILGLKGGDGFLSSGRRRLACSACGWASPEWVKVRR